MVKPETKLAIEAAWQKLYALVTEDSTDVEKLEAVNASLSAECARLRTELEQKKKFISKWMAEARAQSG